MVAGMDDPLGYVLCPVCLGDGTLIENDPRIETKLEQLTREAAAAHKRADSESNFRKIHELRHDQGKLTAYRLLLEAGIVNTWQDFNTIWYRVRYKNDECKACGHPLLTGG